MTTARASVFIAMNVSGIVWRPAAPACSGTAVWRTLFLAATGVQPVCDRPATASDGVRGRPAHSSGASARGEEDDGCLPDPGDAARDFDRLNAGQRFEIAVGHGHEAAA